MLKAVLGPSYSESFSGPFQQSPHPWRSHFTALYLGFPPCRTGYRHSYPVRCFKEVSREGYYLWTKSHKRVSNLVSSLMAAHQSVSQLSAWLCAEEGAEGLSLGLLSLSFCEQWINPAFLTILSLFKTVALFILWLGYKNETNQPMWSSGNSFGVWEHISEKTCSISCCLSPLGPLLLFQ